MVSYEDLLTGREESEIYRLYIRYCVSGFDDLLFLKWENNSQGHMATRQTEKIKNKWYETTINNFIIARNHSIYKKKKYTQLTINKE